MTAAVAYYYRRFELPWTVSEEERERFRRIWLWAIGMVLAIGLIGALAADAGEGLQRAAPDSAAPGATGPRAGCPAAAPAAGATGTRGEGKAAKD